jgi:hypothetical protein
MLKKLFCYFKKRSLFLRFYLKKKELESLWVPAPRRGSRGGTGGGRAFRDVDVSGGGAIWNRQREELMWKWKYENQEQGSSFLFPLSFSPFYRLLSDTTVSRKGQLSSTIPKQEEKPIFGWRKLQEMEHREIWVRDKVLLFAKWGSTSTTHWLGKNSLRWKEKLCENKLMN